MPGIPPTIATDSEDVAWALQTAEALWKRSERLDAIVWLRRAAQAAGEAEDDDRALTLARGAAELAEWIAQAAPGGADATEESPVASDIVVDQVDEVVDAADQDDNVPTIAPPPMAPRTPAPPHDAPEPGAAAVSTAPAGTQEHVPTAAEKHAGMLDPWSEGEGPTGVSATAAAPAPPPHFPPPAARVASVHHEPPAPPPLPPPPRAPSVHHEPPPAPPRTPSVHHEPTATPQPRAGC